MSQLAKVIVTDYLTNPDLERRVLDGHAQIVCLAKRIPEELLGQLTDADVILCFHDVLISRAVLEDARQCRGVIRVGVGFNNVDIRAAGELGIAVCNVPDYGTEEVADHAMAFLLALARRIVPAVEAVRRGDWFTSIDQPVPRLRGQTVGIIGCGRIGTAFALRAKAFGLRVVFYDPYVPRGYEKAIGVERAETLDDFLPLCNFVSLHCPSTPETRHILDKTRLGQLPRGCYVINTARGGLIDESALLEALDEGHLAAAALDVLETEPLDNDRLRRHPNLLITPHSAFFSMVAGPELRTKAAQEALRFIRSERPLNVVNAAFLKHSRSPM